MFSLRLASCWRVEVMKGGAGLRCLSWRFTPVTVKGAACTASMTALTSASLFSSTFFSFP